MKKNKKIWIGALAFIAVVAILGGVYFFTRPETTVGDKNVEVSVVNKEGETENYQVNTDAEYLIDVLEDAKELGLTYEGTDGEYGMMIDTVNGEKAVYTENNSYWAFYVNGGYCEYGVSEQPVEDGDKFEIKYTIGE